MSRPEAPLPGTLTALLRARAAEQPEHGFTFIAGSGAKPIQRSLPALRQEVETLASGMRRRPGVRKGDRVIVAMAPGHGFVAALLACAAAGLAAVPMYPPDPANPEPGLRQIDSVIADCQPVFGLAPGALHPLLITNTTRRTENTAALPWLDRDVVAAHAIEDCFASPPLESVVGPEDLAVLLYTSGSTGTPKGVMLRHGNLLHAARVMSEDCRFGPQTTFGIWLPPYHISGLFSGIVLPLWAGGNLIGFSPQAFIEQPLLWLETISRYRCTASGAPTFAYGLCARAAATAAEETLSALDLSSWKTAVVGGEAVRSEVLDAFVARFGRCGFRAEAFYAMFGLTEAAMISTGTGYDRGAPRESIDRDRLQAGHALQVVADCPTARQMVGSGKSLPETQVIVVDSVTCTPVPPRHVGEIWIGGAAVGAGYWGRAEATTDSFHARIPEEPDTFLRTGDLGYCDEGGQLYIVGRSKETIVVRGLNFYPDDIEGSVQRILAAGQAAQPSTLAAYAVDDGDQERLILALELPSLPDASRADALLGTIRRAVANDHGLQVDGIVLRNTGEIPRTRTGKVQRSQCADLTARGVWPIYGTRSRRREGGPDAPEGLNALSAAGKPHTRLALDRIALPALTAELVRLITDILEIDATHFAADQSIANYGIDSIQVVRLMLAIDDRFGAALPATAFRDGTTVEGIAAALHSGSSAGVSEADMPPRHPRLDAAIRPDSATTAPTVQSGAKILLTGATGFLGGYLLRDLLRSDPESTVHCLVRAEDPKTGWQRLKQRLQSIGGWDEAFAPRLIAVPADIAMPQLGLSTATYNALAAHITTIFHNAAAVDFVASYQALCNPNVQAVETLLTFAATGPIKPLHFTSSLAVFNSPERLQFASLTEADSLTDSHAILGGYAQSKWVAEALIAQAAERGIPASLYRAAFVSGDTQTGDWNSDDFLCRLIKGSIQLGVYPEIDLNLALVPADHVSRAIVSLAGSHPMENLQIAHLLSAAPTPFCQLMEWTRAAGYDLTPVPYSRWQRILRDALPTSNALFPILPFLISTHRQGGETVLDLFLRPGQPVFADAATRHTLDKNGISPSLVDAAYIHTCLRRFQKIGFLPLPGDAP